MFFFVCFTQVLHDNVRFIFRPTMVYTIYRMHGASCDNQVGTNIGICRHQLVETLFMFFLCADNRYTSMTCYINKQISWHETTIPAIWNSTHWMSESLMVIMELFASDITICNCHHWTPTKHLLCWILSAQCGICYVLRQYDMPVCVFLCVFL